jgi:hypothetical protein
MQTTLTLLSPPRNQTCKILLAMIQGRMITEQDFRINGFRTRISELRLDYGLPIHFAWKEFTSEFGEPGKCKSHFILEVDREQAIEVYEKLNSKK